MGMGQLFSGKQQRMAGMAQAAQQQQELDRQRTEAQTQQAQALQGTLDAETNRLLRIYGTRSLLAGGGLRAAA